MAFATNLPSVVGDKDSISLSSSESSNHGNYSGDHSGDSDSDSTNEIYDDVDYEEPSLEDKNNDQPEVGCLWNFSSSQYEYILSKQWLLKAIQDFNKLITEQTEQYQATIQDLLLKLDLTKIYQKRKDFIESLYLSDRIELLLSQYTNDYLNRQCSVKQKQYQKILEESKLRNSTTGRESVESFSYLENAMKEVIAEEEDLLQCMTLMQAISSSNRFKISVLRKHLVEFSPKKFFTALEDTIFCQEEYQKLISIFYSHLETVVIPCVCRAIDHSANDENLLTVIEIVFHMKDELSEKYSKTMKDSIQKTLNSAFSSGKLSKEDIPETISPFNMSIKKKISSTIDAEMKSYAKCQRDLGSLQSSHNIVLRRKKSIAIRMEVAQSKKHDDEPDIGHTDCDINTTLSNNTCTETAASISNSASDAQVIAAADTQDSDELLSSASDKEDTISVKKQEDTGSDVFFSLDNVPESSITQDVYTPEKTFSAGV